MQYKLTIPGRLPGLNELIEAERSNRYKGAQLKKDAERLPLASAAAPRLDAPRVDRAQPSGNDFLADALNRPRRHKRKG